MVRVTARRIPLDEHLAAHPVIEPNWVEATRRWQKNRGTTIPVERASNPDWKHVEDRLKEEFAAIGIKT